QVALSTEQRRRSAHAPRAQVRDHPDPVHTDGMDDPPLPTVVADLDATEILGAERAIDEDGICLPREARPEPRLVQPGDPRGDGRGRPGPAGDERVDAHR